MNAAQLYRLVVHHLLRLGVPGGLGLVLLMAAVAWSVLVHQPDIQRIESLQNKVARLEAKLAEPQVDEPASPVEKLQAFYKSIPERDKIPDRLNELFKLASETGLSLDIGDYTLVHEVSGRLDRFQITFPVKGSYPKLRQFIFAAIEVTPGLALESIAFKRERIGDGEVEARLSFLLFVEKAK
jgi:Tfp pilus assembly protein PilO